MVRSSRGFQNGRNSSILGQRFITTRTPSASALATGETAVAHNHHRSRSGDIYIYPEPYWFLSEKGAVGVMHGSPWRYDQHVPLIFSGPGIDAGHYTRRVNPRDAAPTLAALLGISAPAAAEGSVLQEIFNP